MDQILYLNACQRPHSRTELLARRVLSHLEGQVEEVRLYDESLPPLDTEGMARREKAVAQGDWNDPILRHPLQFAAADTVVVAAPYWDLLFPAVVRSYFEAVTVTGVTFRYTEQGFPQGLCRAKKLIYVTTAGGPIGEYNFGFDYLKALAKLYYGIPEVTCFTAEMLDIVGADVNAIMDDACRRVDQALQRED